MDRLITVVEFAAYRNISQRYDEEKINESILQAQQSDLATILGEFYFDVYKNRNTPEYADLMNGCEFEYNGETYEHVGIKKLLADYVHARYVYYRNVQDTPFGMVTKSSNDSMPIDRNLLKDLSKQDQTDAGVKFKYIEYYILSKPDLFGRYGKCNANPLVSSLGIQRITRF